eukprot:CAMPEP_0195528426 /NCGR_PEP_ID=MMETSP0794_2-20130614/30550_1 /TAXON_ID=515487 /ORGANISM="Stephanopyxis turris, Strain CCMP 815" /LENGTH=691 /DNA_ID=CAMNT_0040659557 /DNA_START=90 /DNA_END=2162 /DNA_ORIENTATION=+
MKDTKQIVFMKNGRNHDAKVTSNNSTDGTTAALHEAIDCSPVFKNRVEIHTRSPSGGQKSDDTRRKKAQNSNSYVETDDKRISRRKIHPGFKVGSYKLLLLSGVGIASVVMASLLLLPNQVITITLTDETNNENVDNNFQNNQAQNEESQNIGDGIRSVSSAWKFFSHVDRDGDGMLRASEVASFISNEIGGSDFDSSFEVESEVNTVMKHLDRNDDDGLDQGDVHAYWNKLESLLTADEVAEWVVHAVQLPDYIGKIFKENSVTGYDFPELVENDGESLKKDLGIAKKSFRKKLVSHIHARMLGIGDVPVGPSGTKHTVENCSTVKFSWRKGHARGFPIHKYRVQRRTIGCGLGESKKRSKEEVLASGTEEKSGAIHHLDQTRDDTIEKSLALISPDNGIHSSLGTISANDWVTIYCGTDTEFIDTNLEIGKTYLYRLQAWSSVGRSAWVTIDISKSLEKKGCAKKPIATRRGIPNFGDSPNLMNGTFSAFWGSYHVASFLVMIIRGIFTLTAMIAAVTRFRRASAPSTSSFKIVPVFPWIWGKVNSISQGVFGFEIIPKAVLNGQRNNATDQATEHDISVGAAGLDGYKKVTNGSETKLTPTPFSRRKLLENKSLSTGHLGARPEARSRADKYERSAVAKVTFQELPFKTQNSDICEFSTALEMDKENYVLPLDGSSEPDTSKANDEYW